MMSYGSYFTTDVNEYVIIISQIDCPRCGVCSGWMAAGSEGGNERRGELSRLPATTPPRVNNSQSVPLPLLLLLLTIIRQ